MTVPLLVGVTGHRDVLDDEVPEIKRQVEALLSLLADQFPDLPVSVISPLAAGADQLVAEVALKMGIPVTALLPMSTEEYLLDFSPEDKARFNALLPACEVVELPMADDPVVDREQHYVNLAGYLAAHSHILLAIWDGQDTRVPGGTSAVIKFHQHDVMAMRDETEIDSAVNFVEDESDLVFHIACSRQSGGRNPDAGHARWLTRDVTKSQVTVIPDRYQAIFDRMGKFNRDSVKNGPGSGYALAQVDPEELPEGVKTIERLFHTTDSLATTFQRRFLVALRLGYSLAILAGLCFIVYADLVDINLMIYGYVGLVCLVIATLQLEARGGWQQSYLEYRVLAEALRVQFYWRLAGVEMDSSYRYAHDAFHERRELQLGWIRNVMRYAALRADAESPSSEFVGTVCQSWITDEHSGQSAYYAKKFAERSYRSRRTKLLEVSGLLSVLLIAIILIAAPDDADYTDWLIALAGFLPLVVAVRQNYAHRLTERELVTQYQYFQNVFKKAEQLLDQAVDQQEQRAILRALGIAALDENSRWVLRQRERPADTGSLVG